MYVEQNYLVLDVTIETKDDIVGFMDIYISIYSYFRELPLAQSKRLHSQGKWSRRRHNFPGSYE